MQKCFARRGQDGLSIPLVTSVSVNNCMLANASLLELSAGINQVFLSLSYSWHLQCCYILEKMVHAVVRLSNMDHTAELCCCQLTVLCHLPGVLRSRMNDNDLRSL